MILKFFAKKDLLVNLPGQVILRGNVDTGARGAPVKYIGRVHIPALTERRNGMDVVLEAPKNPATPEPFECESDSDMGRRLIKLVCRDESLWPADQATADECAKFRPGIKFVQTKFEDGAHVEADPQPLLDARGFVKNCSPVGEPGKPYVKQPASSGSNTPGTQSGSTESEKDSKDQPSKRK